MVSDRTRSAISVVITNIVRIATMRSCSVTSQFGCSKAQSTWATKSASTRSNMSSTASKSPVDAVDFVDQRHSRLCQS